MPGARKTGSLRRAASAAERWWAKVDKRGPDECWPWRASIGTHGYGAFWDGERVTTAPLFGYKLLIGSVPRGLTVDHTCRRRWCVNPGHLEVVTRAENVLRGESITAQNKRKTECVRGHAFDAANTLVIITRRGQRHRRCRTCFNEARRRRYAESCG